MSRPPDERHLQALFHKLAANDRAMTPSFAEVAHPMTPRAKSVRPWAIAAALLLAASVGAAILMNRETMSPQPVAFDFPDLPPAEISLADWESPTAYLLEVSYDVAEAGASPASRSATNNKQEL